MGRGTLLPAAGRIVEPARVREVKKVRPGHVDGMLRY
jgi:hypothetical protein